MISMTMAFGMLGVGIVLFMGMIILLSTATIGAAFLQMVLYCIIPLCFVSFLSALLLLGVYIYLNHKMWFVCTPEMLEWQKEVRKMVKYVLLFGIGCSGCCGLLMLLGILLTFIM